LRIIKWLEFKGIGYVHQKPFSGCRDKGLLKFDFYIPSKNTLIEFDGEQHFMCGFVGKYKTTLEDLENIQRKDAIKTKWAMDNDKKLVRIPYTDMNDIETILQKQI